MSYVRKDKYTIGKVTADVHLCVNSYHDLDPLLLYWSLVIGGITNSHQCVHMKLLQLLADIKREDFRHGMCKHTQTAIETDTGIPR